MKLLYIVLLVLGIVSADVFNGDKWKQVKSPLDSPRYQLILSKIFPESSLPGKVNRGGRIAGGELAKLGQFVHQALLLTQDKLDDVYVCGGAIISHNYILTVSHKNLLSSWASHSYFSQAAHCIDEIVKVSVYVGIIDRINGPAIWGIDVVDKAHMIMHEQYSATGIINDIALVRLVNTITNNANVGIVQLPLTSDKTITLEGIIATIAGFGRTTDVSGPSQYLRWVQAPLVANEICEKVYGKANVHDTNICLDTTGGRSSCQGDSGE